MTKKRTRENLYQMLFQAEFHQKHELMEQADLFLEGLEGKDATGKAKAALKERYRLVLEHLAEIDEMIEQKSEGWTLSRISKADLSVMRLAVYELLYDENVPDGVAINEAVELAKLYGGEKSFRFVNGVLATIAKERSV